MFETTITGSPSYIFDLDVFASRCQKVKSYLGNIPLTYSMKANPFLLNQVPDSISHIEVCSPGELDICMKMHILPENIIYSGVTKEAWDIEKAVSYGVDLLTAESILHVELENAAVKKLYPNETQKRKLILRLTCGNQFGMSPEDICYLISRKEEYSGLDFYGIHYYSGTQKKNRQIKKDFERITKLLNQLKEEYDYVPQLIEYGPGASVDYFEAPYDETDWSHFEEVMGHIRSFAEQYPIGIEMGRFLATSCGHYITQIKDSKRNSDTNYLICDGGIHHLKYFGQTMAMQIPPIDVIPSRERTTAADTDKIPYMLCGSLCTTADILVREVELPAVSIGDYLVFHRCGAYSVTEGTVLFLSRTMPRILLYTKEKGLVIARDFMETNVINMAGDML